MKSNQMKYRLDPHHKWMTRFEAGVTGSPREAHERKWVLAGWVEIPCA